MQPIASTATASVSVPTGTFVQKWAGPLGPSPDLQDYKGDLEGLAQRIVGHAEDSELAIDALANLCTRPDEVGALAQKTLVAAFAHPSTKQEERTKLQHAAHWACCELLKQAHEHITVGMACVAGWCAEPPSGPGGLSVQTMLGQVIERQRRFATPEPGNPASIFSQTQTASPLGLTGARFQKIDTHPWVPMLADSEPPPVTELNDVVREALKIGKPVVSFVNLAAKNAQGELTDHLVPFVFKPRHDGRGVDCYVLDVGDQPGAIEKLVNSRLARAMPKEPEVTFTTVHAPMHAPGGTDHPELLAHCLVHAIDHALGEDPGGDIGTIASQCAADRLAAPAQARQDAEVASRALLLEGATDDDAPENVRRSVPMGGGFEMVLAPGVDLDLDLDSTHEVQTVSVDDHHMLVLEPDIPESDVVKDMQTREPTRVSASPDLPAKFDAVGEVEPPKQEPKRVDVPPALKAKFDAMGLSSGGVKPIYRDPFKAVADACQDKEAGVRDWPSTLSKFSDDSAVDLANDTLWLTAAANRDKSSAVFGSSLPPGHPFQEAQSLAEKTGAKAMVAQVPIRYKLMLDAFRKHALNKDGNLASIRGAAKELATYGDKIIGNLKAAEKALADAEKSMQKEVQEQPYKPTFLEKVLNRTDVRLTELDDARKAREALTQFRTRFESNDLIRATTEFANAAQDSDESAKAARQLFLDLEKPVSTTMAPGSSPG